MGTNGRRQGLAVQIGVTVPGERLQLLEHLCLEGIRQVERTLVLVELDRRIDRRERIFRAGQNGRPDRRIHPSRPWHCLYFFPEPHGQGSLRPILLPKRRNG